jgi:hypothetical protein
VADLPIHLIPPSRSSLRWSEDPKSGDWILTNDVDLQRVAEDLAIKSPAAGRLLRFVASRGVRNTAAAGAGCVQFGMVGFGYLMFAFGVIFFGFALWSVLVWNQPFQINGRNANQLETLACLIPFAALWLGFVALWIYIARRGMRTSTSPWQLRLSPDLWTAHSLGGGWKSRVAPHTIELVRRTDQGLFADHAHGSSQLTGALPHADADWLRNALHQHLQLPIPEESDPVAAAVYPAVPDPGPRATPGVVLAWRLKSDATHPYIAAAVMTVVALIWNGITYGAAWSHLAQWKGGLWNALGLLFFVPFILIGLVLAVIAVFLWLQGLAHARSLGTVVEISSHPVVRGVPIEVLIAQGGNYAHYQIGAELICEERATFRQGTDTRTETRIVRTVPLVPTEEVEIRPGQSFQRRLPLLIPADAMHSFAGTHNTIEWKIKVEGGPAANTLQKWLAATHTFPLVVVPAPPPAAPAAAEESRKPLEPWNEP